LGLAISFPGLAGTISNTLYFSGGWQMSPLKLSAGLGGSPAATLQAAEPPRLTRNLINLGRNETCQRLFFQRPAVFAEAAG
jgi:hypothetical protein